MGLFSKKLTSIQQAELREFANSLNAMRGLCIRAIDDFHLGTLDLYHICFRVRTQDRELQEVEDLEVVERPTPSGVWETEFRKPGVPTNVATLIEEARRAVESYTDFLIDAQAKVSALKPADWYPKRYRKAFDSWTFYFSYLLSEICLKFVADALQIPEAWQ